MAEQEGNYPGLDSNPRGHQGSRSYHIHQMHGPAKQKTLWFSRRPCNHGWVGFKQPGKPKILVFGVFFLGYFSPFPGLPPWEPSRSWARLSCAW